MPAHPVYCSSCGCSQVVESTSGAFYLHCDLCLAITIGLQTDWAPPTGTALYDSFAVLGVADVAGASAETLAGPVILTDAELTFLCESALAS